MTRRVPVVAMTLNGVAMSKTPDNFWTVEVGSTSTTPAPSSGAQAASALTLTSMLGDVVHGDSAFSSSPSAMLVWSLQHATEISGLQAKAKKLICRILPADEPLLEGLAAGAVVHGNVQFPVTNWGSVLPAGLLEVL